MDIKLNVITKYQIIRLSVTVIISIFFVILLRQYDTALNNVSYFSGWSMFLVTTGLLLFNIRKKISFLPIGTVKNWAQWHYYGGVIVSVLFLEHIHYKLPNGQFESLLFYFFVSVVVTGIFGLYITRRIPIVSAQHNVSVIYEHIPYYRSQIHTMVENLKKEYKEKYKTSLTIGLHNENKTFQLNHLQNIRQHLFCSRQPFVRIERHFNSLEENLSTEQKIFFEDIRKQYTYKTELDFQQVSQRLLKYWLFFHIPLSYGLLILVLFHILLTHSFIGETP